MAGTLLVLPRKRGVPFSSSAFRGGTAKMRSVSQLADTNVGATL
jgi:hypothetical protein